jgi:dienelactone hydrolase
MHLRSVVAITLVLLAIFAAGIYIAPVTDRVVFKDSTGKVELIGHLRVPAGIGPFPAAVFLHGCSGLGPPGRIFSTYESWSDHLTEAGYAVLMVDSAGSRGFGRTCGPSEERTRMYRERPTDAYGALAFLQSRWRIDPSRISLIGWSQGGGIALLSIVDNSIGRPSPPPEHDFNAAVAFYPAACSITRQSKPYTESEPGEWRPVAPLLVLQGGADNWTTPDRCVVFIDTVRAHGHPAEIIVYPGAYHSFDAPNMPIRERREVTMSNGQHPIVGTDKAAREDALKRVVDFLEANAVGQ